MKYITVSDEDIDFVASKWLLETALNSGCDSFSFDLESVGCIESQQVQSTLLDSLRPHYIGSHTLEKLVVYNPAPNVQNQDCWEFNRDTLRVIMDYMGRHLLDWDVALNSGIKNWRFFKQWRLKAGAAYDDDYFIFIEPPARLVEILERKNIPLLHSKVSSD